MLLADSLSLLANLCRTFATIATWFPTSSELTDNAKMRDLATRGNLKGRPKKLSERCILWRYAWTVVLGSESGGQAERMRTCYTDCTG